MTKASVTTTAARLFALLMSTIPMLVLAQGPAPLLTGEVYSRQAQEVIVPLTTNWQARISALVPEGSFVDQGDVVVKFDGTEAARQLEQQRETARTELARTERDVARLEKELAQAKFGLDKAVVTLNLTEMKAEIPKGLIGALEHAENELAYEEAIKAHEDAIKQLEDKKRGLDERIKQASLDARKMEIQEQWWAQMLESFVVTAAQPGFVIYKNHPWTRAKFQEGDNVQTSFRIAQVANTEDLAIKVWINGVDRPRIEAGTHARITFDALPTKHYEGTITYISAGGAKRGEWGEALYFEAIVEIEGEVSEQLLPGMSALVEVES